MTKRVWLARSYKNGALSGSLYYFLYTEQPIPKVRHDFKDNKPIIHRWWENRKGTDWGYAGMDLWDSFGLKLGECCEIEVSRKRVRNRE